MTPERMMGSQTRWSPVVTHQGGFLCGPTVIFHLTLLLLHCFVVMCVA